MTCPHQLSNSQSFRQLIQNTNINEIREDLPSVDECQHLLKVGWGDELERESSGGWGNRPGKQAVEIRPCAGQHCTVRCECAVANLKEYITEPARSSAAIEFGKKGGSMAGTLQPDPHPCCRSSWNSTVQLQQDRKRLLCETSQVFIQCVNKSCS